MKPQSMSNREWFIKKIAVNNNISEKTINAIINHQFQAISLNLQTNDTLEVSGFGKFIFNRKKAEKKLYKLHHTKNTYIQTIANPETTELRCKNAKRLLIQIEQSIDSLTKKLYGTIKNI